MRHQIHTLGTQMKTADFAGLVIAAGLGIASLASAGSHLEATADAMPRKDVVEPAMAVGSFGTLVQALKAADLIATFSG